jgi:uncharacterized RDD family membrane protein YckC
MEDKSQFAGFWKRAGAYLIDCLIIGAGAGIVFGIGFVCLFIVLKLDRQAFGFVGLLIYVLGFLTHVLYHSLFESSSKQATPGKMALGIVVTDSKGGRISFWRAVGRNCGRYISSLVFGLGYIICAFTERRQAVHDLLASTLVVNNDAPLRIGGQDEFKIMKSA